LNFSEPLEMFFFIDHLNQKAIGCIMPVINTR